MKSIKLVGIVVLSCIITAALSNITKTEATVPKVNELVSVDSSEAQSNDTSYYSSQSYNGHYVVFDSQASNLVSGDTNADYDVFLRDRTAGNTIRVSVDSSGTQANNRSREAKISHDGRYIVYSSDATNLVSGDTNAKTDIFRYTVSTGTTELVSKAYGSSNGGDNISSTPSISADGNLVLFKSNATDLINGGASAGQIYLRDMSTGTTKVVSKDYTGAIIASQTPSVPSMSCDGGIIAFKAFGSSLVSGDTNGVADIFVVDRVDGHKITNITIGASTYPSELPNVSCDGNYVTFSSHASNLVAGDANSQTDVFRYNRMDGTIEIVSKSSGGTLGNFQSDENAISGDGRFVTFQSDATNLTAGSDTNNRKDIFIKDMYSGTVELLTVNSSSQQANDHNYYPSISADGKFVAYQAGATNLVGSDTNSRPDMIISETGY